MSRFRKTDDHTRWRAAVNGGLGSRATTGILAESGYMKFSQERMTKNSGNGLILLITAGSGGARS